MRLDVVDQHCLRQCQGSPINQLWHRDAGVLTRSGSEREHYPMKVVHPVGASQTCLQGVLKAAVEPLNVPLEWG
jgi:hypothetical protein